MAQVTVRENEAWRARSRDLRDLVHVMGMSELRKESIREAKKRSVNVAEAAARKKSKRKF